MKIELLQNKAIYNCSPLYYTTTSDSVCFGGQFRDLGSVVRASDIMLACFGGQFRCISSVVWGLGFSCQRVVVNKSRSL